MAWVKIDDNAPHHRKQLAAGPLACWLWVCGLAYCQKHATDGLIPGEAVPFLGVKEWQKCVPLLVKSGLWIADAPAGYRVHDFLHWNDSAAVRKERISESAERVARYRQSKKRAVTRDGNSVTPLPSGNAGNGTPIPTPQPIPQPIPIPEVRRAGARAPLTTNSAKTWGLRHSDHVAGFCTWMCLPIEDFGRFSMRLGGDDAAKAWADSVKASGIVPTGKPWEFWNQQFDAAHVKASQAVSDDAARQAERERVAERERRYDEWQARQRASEAAS